MTTSFFRSTAAVAAVGVGALSFMSGPAGAQVCYPPTPGCITTTAPPTVAPTSIVSTTSSTTSSTVGGTGTGTGGTGRLARTGIYLIPALLIGLGLVTGGVALKRSGKRSKANSAV